MFKPILDDPARASEMFDGYFGPMSFEGAIDRFRLFRFRDPRMGSGASSRTRRDH
jgi:hypothetical protein